MTLVSNGIFYCLTKMTDTLKAGNTKGGSITVPLSDVVT